MKATNNLRTALTSFSLGRRNALRSIGVGATVPLFAPLMARAQNLPDTVRIVIGVPAGNPVESVARAMADALNQTSGRTYIVENKPGAAGTLAAREVARAKPDGSTILWINGSHTTFPAIYEKLPFDPVADFTPISKVMSTSGFALLVRADSPFKTVQDLIKAAQQQPNKISYASLGIGNTLHLLGELFANAVKAKFLHIPYSASPIPDLLGGHVDFTWLGISISKQMIDSGKVRVLAVSSSQRIPEAPNAPTFAEMGIKEVDVPAWGGIVGPRGMSADIANKIQREVSVAVKHQAFLNYVKSSGDMDVMVDPPAVFGTYIKTEVDRFRKLLGPLGIKLQLG
jgi:tripartite-type tricarboxylate transporter receptor subunit TctC